MTDALNPERKELLSSYLDNETPQTEYSETEHLLKDSFGAQVHYRNLETVIQACQQQSAPVSQHDDFLGNLMGRIDGLEQDNEFEDPECISAWIDGQYELDVDALEASATASVFAQNLRTLSRSLKSLPQPSCPSDFVQKLMKAVDLSTEPNLDLLSAFYDRKVTSIPIAAELLSSEAQETLKNYETLSHAMAHLSVAPSPHFVTRVMDVLTENSNDLSFELCSAYFDEEANLEYDSVSEIGDSLKDIERLSLALRALPKPLAPEGFLDAVMQRVDPLLAFEALSAAFDGELKQTEPSDDDTTHNFTVLSQAMKQLPVFEASEHFIEQLMQRLDSDLDFETLSTAFDDQEKMELYQTHPRQRDLQALSRALNNLPQPEVPVDFVARVMAVVELQSDFEQLSAHYDGEALDSKVDELSLQGLPEMKQIQALSRALQTLPQPECSHDFVARVMLATEQTHKARIFALPALFQTRLGQLVAGFALFGVLALITQSLLTGTEEVASVPETTIVQVQYQAEDILFADVLDDSLENVAENDYNLLIGG